jgi:hypothetical protein
VRRAVMTPDSGDVQVKESQGERAKQSHPLPNNSA